MKMGLVLQLWLHGGGAEPLLLVSLRETAESLLLQCTRMLFYAAVGDS